MVNAHRIGIVAAVMWCLVTPVLIAEEALPELDVVTTAKITPATLPQDFVESVTRSLDSDARMLFPKLMSNRGGPAGADGAAKYRLFVEYTATITLGNQVSMKMERLNDQGGNFTVRRWYMAIDQKASFSVRLAKWSGDRYVDHVKFTLPVVKTAAERAAGPVMVTQNSNRTGTATDTDALPITMEEAKKSALQNARPPSLRHLLFSSLVPVTVVKATPTRMEGGKPAELAVDLKIDNKSPWPLKSVEVTFVQGGMEYAAVDEKGNLAMVPAEPIAPGKPANMKALARPNQGFNPPGTQRVDFVVPSAQ